MIDLKEIKYVIFDVDGTIADSMGAWDDCYRKYMEIRGLPANLSHRARLRLMSVDDGGRFLKEQYSLPEDAKDITAAFNKIILDFYTSEAQMKPHILDMMNAFSEKGIKLAVATASSEDIILPLLTHLGIVDRFENILTVRNIGLPKSDPEFFTRCISVLGIKPENAVMVEDMPHATVSAKKAGLKTIGVKDRQKPDEEKELIKEADLYLCTDEDYEKFINHIIT